MTLLKSVPPLRAPLPGPTGVAERTPSTPGSDGVVGDVILTVLLAGAVAAIVGALLVLLWHALPSASRIAALTFAMAVPPPPRRLDRADGPDGAALRAVLLRVAVAAAIPIVAIGVTFAVWSRDEIAAPAAMLVGLLLVVVELKLLGSESWRRARRAGRRR